MRWLRGKVSDSQQSILTNANAALVTTLSIVQSAEIPTIWHVFVLYLAKNQQEDLPGHALPAVGLRR